MGRKPASNTLIEDGRKRDSTFSKRMHTVFKKCMDARKSCGAAFNVEARFTDNKGRLHIIKYKSDEWDTLPADESIPKVTAYADDDYRKVRSMIGGAYHEKSSPGQPRGQSSLFSSGSSGNNSGSGSLNVSFTGGSHGISSPNNSFHSPMMVAHDTHDPEAKHHITTSTHPDKVSSHKKRDSEAHTRVGTLFHRKKRRTTTDNQ
jgi:hypothetical protein